MAVTELRAAALRVEQGTWDEIADAVEGDHMRVEIQLMPIWERGRLVWAWTVWDENGVHVTQGDRIGRSRRLALRAAKKDARAALRYRHLAQAEITVEVDV